MSRKKLWNHKANKPRHQASPGEKLLHWNARWGLLVGIHRVLSKGDNSHMLTLLTKRRVCNLIRTIIIIIVTLLLSSSCVWYHVVQPLYHRTLCSNTHPRYYIALAIFRDFTWMTILKPISQQVRTVTFFWRSYVCTIKRYRHRQTGALMLGTIIIGKPWPSVISRRDLKLVLLSA